MDESKVETEITTSKRSVFDAILAQVGQRRLRTDSLINTYVFFIRNWFMRK